MNKETVSRIHSAATELYKAIEDAIMDSITQCLEDIVKEEIAEAMQPIYAKVGTLPQHLMSRTEVAQYLGCSLPTVHNLMLSGRLKYVKVGNNTRFETEEVKRFAESGGIRGHIRKKPSYRTKGELIEMLAQKEAHEIVTDETLENNE